LLGDGLDVYPLFKETAYFVVIVLSALTTPLSSDQFRTAALLRLMQLGPLGCLIDPVASVQMA
jgi:hypothetical protein